MRFIVLLLAMLLLPLTSGATPQEFFGSNTSPGRLVSTYSARVLTLFGAPTWGATTPPEGDHWLASVTTNSDYYLFPAAACPASGAGTTGSICFYFIGTGTGVNQEYFLFSNGAGSYFSVFYSATGSKLIVEMTTTSAPVTIEATGLTDGVLYSSRISWDAAGTSSTVYLNGSPVAFSSDARLPSFTATDAHSAVGNNNYGAASWPLTNASIDALQISTDPYEVFPPPSAQGILDGVTNLYLIDRLGTFLTPRFIRGH